MAAPPLYYVFLQHSVAISRRFDLEATLDHCHAASLVYQKPLARHHWPCGKRAFYGWELIDEALYKHPYLRPYLEHATGVPDTSAAYSLDSMLLMAATGLLDSRASTNTSLRLETKRQGEGFERLQGLLIEWLSTRGNPELQARCVGGHFYCSL